MQALHSSMCADFDTLNPKKSLFPTVTVPWGIHQMGHREVQFANQKSQHIHKLIKHKPSCHISGTRVLAAFKRKQTGSCIRKPYKNSWFDFSPGLLIKRTRSAILNKDRHMFRLQSGCRHCIRPCVQHWYLKSEKVSFSNCDRSMQQNAPSEKYGNPICKSQKVNIFIN